MATFLDIFAGIGGFRHGLERSGWMYEWIPYSASLTATMKIRPDEKSPTATSTQMKSGYGLNMNVSSQVRSTAPSGDITGMQNVVSYFPDGRYTTYAECMDAWMPAGMLQINLTDDITIRDSLFSDWHIGPVK